MTSRIGELIGRSLKEQNSIKATQGIEPGTISSYFVFGNYRFKILITKILIEKQNIAGTNLIWGNATYGVYDGVQTWNNEASLDAYTTKESIILNQTIPDIAREEIAKWVINESAGNPT